MAINKQSDLQLQALLRSRQEPRTARGDSPDAITAAAGGIVVQTITNGDTTHAPSGDSVYDALALKAPLASPTFTGNPTAPTPSPGDNDTSIATTAFVTAAVAAGAYTDEQAQDAVAAALAAGTHTNITVTYNDAGNSISLAATAGSTPTGTGFTHITAGSQDAAAVTIDGQSTASSGDVKVVAPATHAATSKATPVDADELPLADSAASYALKKLTWANLKATLNYQIAVQYKWEGSALGTSGTVTELDVTGAGATASRAGDKITINVPGAVGGGGSVSDLGLVSQLPTIQFFL